LSKRKRTHTGAFSICLVIGRENSAQLAHGDDSGSLLVRKAAAYLFKVLFRCAAQGADPIGGQILKIGSFLDTVIGITDLRTVFITAQLASIYAHSYPSFQLMMIFPQLSCGMSVVYNIA
jgi:hypothetical protein